MSDNLQFRISSSLKDIIGKDLITDDFIAVFELVKNSYDAHAKEVKLIFEEDSITIIDNGKGMSLHDIREKWLFVAYSAKKEGVEDQDILTDDEYKDYRDKIAKRKYFAGAKGIGRFSCDRLGDHLTMYSKKVNHREIEKINIDWKDFEADSKKEFINIKVQHETLVHVPFKDFESGTILVISGLNALWNRKKILHLKHSLEKLINPFESLISRPNTEIEFIIKFIVNSESGKDATIDDPRQKVNGLVQNFIFNRLSVATTQIITSIDQQWITSEIIDRGTPIYKIKEQNTEYSLLEDARFHVYYLNKGAKISFTRSLGLEPVKFGSIFLFKNGFRIYPIGEEGDDTLRIDRRKQQGYARYLGSRDLLGRIEIFGEGQKFNELFKESTSRDSGLIDTVGFEELIDAFYDKSLKRLEKYVVDIQWALKDTEDKNQEDTSIYEYDSKKKIINIIHTLTSSKNIELVSYNKDFLNIIESKVDDDTETIDQLYTIAIKSGDDEYAIELQRIKKEYQKLIKEKFEAEERANRADEARQKADIEREEAEKRRKEAELKYREEEQKRKDAELREREAKIQATEALLAAKLEKEAKERAEIEAKETAEELDMEKKKNKYLSFKRSTIDDDTAGLIHHIALLNDIPELVNILIRNINNGLIDKLILTNELINIKKKAEKVLAVSKLITGAGFKKQIDTQRIDIPVYIEEYINNYYEFNDKQMLQLNCINKSGSFFKQISPLDLSIILDNLISNAKKWNAKKMIFEIEKIPDVGLRIIITDDGSGLSPNLLKNPSQIFQLGITETEGAGIGLYYVNSILQGMYGNISFLGNNVRLKGAGFQIIFK